MQGLIESLLPGILLRGLSPGLGTVLMAAAPKKVSRAHLKKIYVLDERGEVAGEYLLDTDCPIDYNDFLKVLPDEGIGDRESLYVGEYVFTAFQSGKFVFVLLSRGQLSREDFDWTALLLTAADSHLTRVGRTPTSRTADAKPEAETALADREARLMTREKTLAELEANLQAEQANLAGRREELERQKQRVAALADYSAAMHDAVTKGVSRAVKTMEVTEEIVASSSVESTKADGKATLELRQQFEQERKGLLAAKAELEAKYRDAVGRISELETQAKDAVSALEQARTEAEGRLAEEEKTRREIETRVAELSQRFAAMAKERLVASHRGGEPTEPVKRVEEGEKAELARERKFLQRRAIELLDREERVRDRETKVEERERSLARRDEELSARERDAERQRALLAQAKPQPADARTDSDEARKDIERRVKIIQQKALELLDREEKLRKRAAELEAMESRLTGKVAAR